MDAQGLKTKKTCPCRIMLVVFLIIAAGAALIVFLKP